MLRFIFLDILQTDLWLNKYLANEYTDIDDAYSPLNYYFDRAGFSSFIIMINLGSSFVYLAMILSMYALLPIIYILTPCLPIAIRLYNKLNGMLFWNFSIRFMIQQFQPLVLVSMISF